MKILENFLSWINSFFWNGPMLILLFASHLYFTFRLGFIQKKLPQALRLSVGLPAKKSGQSRKKILSGNRSEASSDSMTNNQIEKSGSTASQSRDNSPRVSSFMALTTTLAATLGTGNIIGVSSAIALGGPGALFWCFLTGVFGMATTYAECFIGIKYRRRMPDGSYMGGPMYALEAGLGRKRMARFYAFATVFASYGIGCSTQSRAFTDAAVSFGLPRIPTGIFLALLVGLVIIGGAKRIHQLCMKLVPVMGGVFLFCCILILLRNLPFVLPAITLMLRSAFSVRAVTAGTLSGCLMTAMRYGVARGLFTNEAGLGSAAIAAADADTKHPSEQALVSMTATFWDTIVMCALTGIAILSTALTAPESLAGFSMNDLTHAAFLRLSAGGPKLLNLCLMAFAFATLVGWSYFGEKAVLYLTGERGLYPYKTGYLVMIFLGSILSMSFIWQLTDFANLGMALPNLFALFYLRKEVQKASL